MRQREGRAVDLQAVALFLVRGTRRAALTAVGFALVCVGLAGLVLPVLPGWVLIIGGFAVLSREYSWAASGLAFARRHATKSGSKLRSLAARRPASTLACSRRRPRSDRRSTGTRRRSDPSFRA